MEKNEKTIAGTVDANRPKTDWDPNSCPFFIFGDDDAAEYDLDKMKKFFDRFKKKKKN